jgi:hypothetical protein
MVDEGGSRVTITTDGDTLVGPVGDDREDVVEFVEYTVGLGDVANGAGW